MTKGKVMFGLLAGAAAGAVAGLLMAPDKGSVTRQNLSRKGRDTVDNLKNKVSGLVETVSEKYMGGHETSQRGRDNSGLERTRSTASALNTPGAPSTNSFT